MIFNKKHMRRGISSRNTSIFIAQVMACHTFEIPHPPDYSGGFGMTIGVAGKIPTPKHVNYRFYTIQIFQFL
jgi:hypothetical protein